MNFIKIIALNTFGLAAISSFAQQSITLQQCRQMALENSESIKMADKNKEKALAEKAIARTYYLPSVSASGTMLYMNKDFTQNLYLPTYVPNVTTGELDQNLFLHPLTGEPVYSDGNPVFNMYAYLPIDLSIKGAYMAGVNIEQAIYTGGKIMAGNKMAQIGENMAQSNWKWTELNILADADQSYWMFVLVNEKVKLAQTAVHMLDSLVQRVQNSYDAGMVHKNELLKVQVKLNQAKLDAQKAQSGLELTRMSVCRITGMPFNTQLVASDTLINCTSDILSSLGDESVSHRPEFELLNQQVAFENEKIKLVLADYLPTMGISAGYSKLGGVELSGSELSSSGMTVIGSLKIPLFSWGQGKQKIASAKINRDIKALELQQNEQLMYLEIEQAKFNLQDAFLRVQIAYEAMAQAEENLRLSQNNYELGAELMTDLLIAQTQWQQAKAEVIEAQAEFKIKETMYLKANGKLSEQIIN
jgi:outer membrane protein TolC